MNFTNNDPNNFSDYSLKKLQYFMQSGIHFITKVIFLLTMKWKSIFCSPFHVSLKFHIKGMSHILDRFLFLSSLFYSISKGIFSFRLQFHLKRTEQVFLEWVKNYPLSLFGTATFRDSKICKNGTSRFHTNDIWFFDRNDEIVALAGNICKMYFSLLTFL